jgi:hypothetical protein
VEKLNALPVEKMDTNLMIVQTRRKKEVKLTLSKHIDGMLRQKMLRAEDH